MALPAPVKSDAVAVYCGSSIGKHTAFSSAAKCESRGACLIFEFDHSSLFPMSFRAYI